MAEPCRIYVVSALIRPFPQLINPIKTSFTMSYENGRKIGVPRGMRPVWCLALVVTTWVPALLSGSQDGQAPTGRPVFRSHVDRVTVSATVRDHRGRLVQNLTQRDFEVLDEGRARQITDFRADAAPVTLAVLLDVSGSMQVGSKVDGARQAADHVMAWLQPERDEIALFTFDRELREARPFGRKERLGGELLGIEPFGLTSLHDAIAEAARRVAARGGSHRGVVVLTDGVDTSSRLTPADVSGIASGIDVPVYIVAVMSPLDDPESPTSVTGRSMVAEQLTYLAVWTGGNLFVASSPAQASLAARQIVEELRHQYLIAFEPGGKPGWHPLEIRARDRKLVVRARSGYFARNS
jgi:Ca-activated chloride channel family protein